MTPDETREERCRQRVIVFLAHEARRRDCAIDDLAPMFEDLMDLARGCVADGDELAHQRTTVPERRSVSGVFASKPPPLPADDLYDDNDCKTPAYHYGWPDERK